MVTAAQNGWFCGPVGYGNLVMELVLVLIFKTVAVLVGGACVWMGFTLFKLGIQEGGAGVETEVSSTNSSRSRGSENSPDSSMSAERRGRFALDRGGPGLVFALFGAVVIVAGIFKPVSVEVKEDGQPSQTSLLNGITW